MTNKVNIMTDPGADMLSVNQAVSLTIKTRRKDKKLSLDELSRRAGVSKGMLVEIEKGSANPSIAILCKIAAALSLSVADIVNVTAAPSAFLVKRPDMPVLWQGDSGGSARLLAGTRGPDMLELWRWEMYPGEKFTSSGHPSGTVELLHVEEGSLTLTVEQSELQVPEGNAAVARTDIPHGYANHSDRLLVFTMSVSERHS
ncbi:XRE family transcriptional regulator [Erwinia sp. JUb26]|uniref:helix-turn-helix domain-containing protein n=1 Tax=Erwinia sp. JUb26 TaxID=2485126 RepID=UPI000F4873AE|nr:XRE family transcriptional regulator [Erwinia sp. JUb26]ROR15079.1 cupin domain [Erwinia sp. JUb26]